MSEEEKRTVRARRRRRVKPSHDRPQAEAPRRERERPRPAPSFHDSGPPPTAGATGGSGKRAMPKLGCGTILLLLLLFLFIIFILPKLMGGAPAPTQNEGFMPPAATEAPLIVATPTSRPRATARPQPTPTPKPRATKRRPTATPVTAGGTGQQGKDTWLVMLYQDADDRVLEKDIYIDLNEAEEVGSQGRVHIVAQVDRYRGGFRGDGNWTTAKRFYVRYDPELDRLASQEIMDLGEVNMADGNTLVDFVRWAVENYPADHYVLILSDHGMGWPGGWSDPTARGRGPDNVPLARAMGDILYLRELDRSLARIQEETGIETFDIIGLDACLMGMAEVFTTLQPYARYAVASEETEPAVGWAYAAFLKTLVENPDISARDLATAIVDTYIDQDQRVLDPKARADMLGQRGLFGVPPAEMVAGQLFKNATLAAVDLQAFGDVLDALNSFAYALESENQRLVAKARAYATGYTSIFGRNAPPAYIDLANFALLIGQNTRHANVRDAAEELVQAIQRAVIAERHGRGKEGSHGISIFFPDSDLYRNPMAGAASYAVTAPRFADQSSWDEFLAFHYTGRKFPAQPERAAVVPDLTHTRAPGLGQIRVTHMRASRKTASPGSPVLLSADIEGENIGYIYIFVGYLDREARSLFVADMDYLETDRTRTLDGVTYPDWGEGAFTLEFEWDPVLYGIDDGRRTALALFQPERFGVRPEDALYAVDGIYTYADGEQRYARLLFSNDTGELVQVFGYTGKDFTGAAREIIPEKGDRFTVLEKWFDLDEEGRMTSLSMEPGDTLVFGNAPFTWREMDPPSGTYVVGFIVEDLDGNRQAVYTTVKVR
ncbi:MAG: hypothetical protein GXO55_06925 [Chloroflexi bacterium]|nr:hypothetical protein [Chloroflexota bacterium]